MRTLLASGIVPIQQAMKDGEVLNTNFFGGPLSRSSQGIGTNLNEGEWNDVREDEMWNDDSDVAQAGQAIGGIHSVMSAKLLTKMMMEEFINVLKRLSGMAEHAPSSIDVGDYDKTVLTLKSFM